jgi:hypothetical protein
MIIYDVITAKPPADPKRATGKVVYYREGIKEPQHKIEDPLNPNTEYFWSVRFRSSENVSAWSTWSYSFYASGVSVVAKNVPFMFKTPGISAVKGIEQPEAQIVVDKNTKVYVIFQTGRTSGASGGPGGNPEYRCFHKTRDCRHLSAVSTEEVTAGEAIARGKIMCPDCFR